jgi:UrcA family protein
LKTSAHLQNRGEIIRKLAHLGSINTREISMTTSNQTRLAVLICAAAAAVFSAPATTMAQQTLQFDRNQLNTASGATRLLSQIEHTARDLCLQENHYGTMRARTVGICLRETIERTVNELDAPCLTTVYITPLAQRSNLLCSGTPQTDVE